MLRPPLSGGAGAEGQRADWPAALQRRSRPLPLEARLVRAGGLGPALQPGGAGRRGGGGGGAPTEAAAGAE